MPQKSEIFILIYLIYISTFNFIFNLYINYKNSNITIIHTDCSKAQ